MKTIKTDRLILRGLELSDLDDFYNYCKNPNIGPRAGWPAHKSIAESREILLRMIRSNEVWAICLSDNKLIGTVGLHQRSPRQKKELGYVLSEEHWGSGIVPEACRAVIKHAFVDQELPKIEIFHFPENIQSRRVIEKLGFVFEGIRRKDFSLWNGEVKDSYSYSLLWDEYKEE